VLYFLQLSFRKNINIRLPATFNKNIIKPLLSLLTLKLVGKKIECLFLQARGIGYGSSNVESLFLARFKNLTVSVPRQRIKSYNKNNHKCHIS
jgi:hypothetical protein